MLSSNETLVIMEARTALLKHGDTELAERLDTVLLNAAKARASVSAARQRSAEAKAGRPPAARLIVEVEPGYAVECLGAKAAHAAVAEALSQLGDKRVLPSANSMGVMLSRQGAWTTLADTDNGTVSITVRRAPETGTDLANAQTVPKAEKRR